MRSYLSGKEMPNYAWGERMRFLRAGQLALLIALGLTGYTAARYTWYAALWWRVQSTAASRAAASDGSAGGSSATDGHVDSTPSEADDRTQAETAVVEQADGPARDDGSTADRGPSPRASLTEDSRPADPATALKSTPTQIGPIDTSEGATPPESPADSQISEAIGAAQDGATAPQPGDESVHLANPIENGGPVHFLADNQIYTLRPGQSLVLPCHGRCRVEFDRGGDFGAAEYAVEPGLYDFTVTESGWALVDADGMPLPRAGPGLPAASP